MRNSLKLAAVAAIALGAATTTSCDKDNGDQPARDEVTILTSIGAMDTRAVIDPATGAGNLVNGDVIKLIYQGTSGGADMVTTYSYTIGTTNLYWDDVVGGVGGTPTSYDFAAYFPDAYVPADCSWNAATAANPDLLFAKATGAAAKVSATLWTMVATASSPVATSPS